MDERSLFAGLRRCPSAESVCSRDSIEAMLERGRSHRADLMDAQAYRLAQWCEEYDPMCLRESEDLHDLYRMFEADQARELLNDVFRKPLIARSVVKEEFDSLRLLFCYGATFGNMTHFLDANTTMTVLKFLGYQPQRKPSCCMRNHCMMFDEVSPIFRHRTEVYITEHSERSYSEYDSDGDSDATEVSTGSVSGAQAALVDYFATFNQDAAMVQTQPLQQELSSEPVSFSERLP
eukprot:TRINITY_DN8288_c0_g1_i1.p1 TRINITY_DN8288_c0_g1~~TRINITY_DN8288_c0_g1_i1.p1  ORF type:complete len:235 (-),score=32.80 TRINITY_DN8288_c0_g1_i1:327-1031(-)